MRVTLQVNGREMTFSEQELSFILEEHFSSKTTERAKTDKVLQKPTEDEWFEVKPQAIDQKLFKKKKEDSRQEATRQLILEAFAEMKQNPEKYGKNFRTMMPKKTWASEASTHLHDRAINLGDHCANWIEQALEWAQRLANGEPWEILCNEKDTANWYRLVVGKHGADYLVGGSVNDEYNYPASNVQEIICDSIFYGSFYGNAVPLVVSYD